MWETMEDSTARAASSRALQIAFGEDFAESAEKGGVPYEHLLRRILSAGLRYHPVRL